MLQCKLSVPPPRGNFDFLSLLAWGIYFSRPSAPGPIKLISAGFAFLPAFVIKRSSETLIKHICEFSIHKY